MSDITKLLEEVETMVREKHLPGRHSQLSHTPHKYRGGGIDQRTTRAVDMVSRLSPYESEGYRASDYAQTKAMLLEQPWMAREAVELAEVVGVPVKLSRLGYYAAGVRQYGSARAFLTSQIGLWENRVAELEGRLDAERAKGTKTALTSAEYTERQLNSVRNDIANNKAALKKLRALPK